MREREREQTQQRPAQAVLYSLTTQAQCVLQIKDHHETTKVLFFVFLLFQIETRVNIIQPLLIILRGKKTKRQTPSTTTLIWDNRGKWVPFAWPGSICLKLAIILEGLPCLQISPLWPKGGKVIVLFFLNSEWETHNFVLQTEVRRGQSDSKQIRIYFIFLSTDTAWILGSMHTSIKYMLLDRGQLVLHSGILTLPDFLSFRDLMYNIVCASPSPAAHVQLVLLMFAILPAIISFCQDLIASSHPDKILPVLT